MNAVTPSARAQVIARRTYQRPTNDAGTTFETWAETIDRVVMHQRWLWERALGDRPLSAEQHAELAELRALMIARKSLVSGRTLWLGGTSIAKARESSSFNCTFLRIVSIHDIVNTFWLLLQGCGVGFEPVMGTLNGFTKPAELEVIRSERGNLVEQRGRETNREVLKDGVWTLQIGDSAEAWAKAAGKIMAQKAPFSKIVLDFSQIRPAGYRLKGYGWISSGDETLCKALVAICGIMSRKAGQLLDRIDILDVVNWLGTTLSSRRSAEIALVPYGDPQWREFASAKKDYWLENPQRGQSNNSLLFYSRPSKHDIRDLLETMVKAGGSEPGFINAEQALERAPWFKGVNPCLTGDTLVPIPGMGLHRIASLNAVYAPVKDGNGKPVTAEFRKTAKNASDLVCVELSDGSRYRVTPSHEFVLAGGEKVRASRLTEGDELRVADITGCFGTHNEPARAYKDAWLIADGTWSNDHRSSKLYLYGPKHKRVEIIEIMADCTFTAVDRWDKMTAHFPGYRCPDKTRVPDYVLAGNQTTASSFVLGYLESDGHIGHTVKGWTVQFCSIHRSFLEDFQALLRLFGVRSKIALMHGARKTMLPDGKGGKAEYDCKPCWRITVGNAVKFMETFSPENLKRGPYDKPEHICVVSVTPHEAVEDVYCCGVPTTGSFDLTNIHSGNCAEILLGDKSPCNLCETNLAAFNGDTDGLHRAVHIIARANYRQTCVNLRDGILQGAWHELNEFLRLCGVGQTGIVQWEHKNNPKAWQKLRAVAQAGCHSAADELGLPRSKCVTTIKPSGTLSKCMDSTEGLHMPLGSHILNNVRFSHHDPILPSLEAAGYRVWQDPTSSDAMLVTFPVHWDNVDFEKDERGKSVNRESALTQLERYRMVMANYVDHNASATISYDPSEVGDIANWIHKSWYVFVGVSFLFRNDASKTAEDLGYPYLPQEVVTEAKFAEYTSRLKPFNLDSAAATLATAKSGGIDESQLVADAGNECAGGMCPVK